MTQVSLPRPLARVTDALKRRYFERRFRTIEVDRNPPPLVRLGGEWGGWKVPANTIDASWICYCVGAGGDVTFDLELIHQFGATVRCFDPFWIFREDAMRKAQGDRRFTFHQYAVVACDGPVTMFGRQDEVHGTVSAANIYRTRRRFELPGRSLESLMVELGDDRIDLLKLDIEGSEYEVLEAINPAELGVRVLCVEFHHTSPASRAIAIVDRLKRDYVVASRTSTSELTLCRKDVL